MGGNVLKIMGSGFSDVIEDVGVTIDGLACIVTAASHDRLLCNTPSARDLPESYGSGNFHTGNIVISDRGVARSTDLVC